MESPIIEIYIVKTDNNVIYGSTGNYNEATTLLEQVKNNRYLNDEERSRFKIYTCLVDINKAELAK